jgi:hypothetical protein
VTSVWNLRIAGVLLLALGAAHVPIAARFHWREEAGRLSPFNRQVLLVHAFFIALTVALQGALLVGWAGELLMPSPLGAPLAGGLALFWAVRLFVQQFVYDRELWRGKRFETVVHVLFTLFWTYLAMTFTAVWRLQVR